MAVHVPVLLPETLEALNLRPGATVIDATFGGGGHSSQIAEVIGQHGQLFGFDQDPNVPTYAKAVLEKYPIITLVQANFSDMSVALQKRNVTAVDAILFDLGVSSFQLDDPSRGFSWKQDAPLDMRMDPTQGETAAELIARFSEVQLAALITEFGEERAAPFIAKAIMAVRQKQPVTMSLQLKEIVHTTVRGSYEYRTGAVARVFQALRIAVNAELTRLPQALYEAALLLKPGGRIVVITFHSLEDRIVKYVFRHLAGKHEPVYGLNVPQPILELVSSKAIQPAYAETKRNPRARSAKLRVGERCA